MGKCLPGTPCFTNTTNPPDSSDCGCNTVFFTNGCNPVSSCINSTNICYSGVDLPNTGINTNDNLTLSLSKIDALLLPLILTTVGNSGVSTLIDNLLNIPNYTLTGLGGISLLSLSAGIGISYDNTTGVITNSAPDQVVTLTQGTNITITGSYPNFTIASSGGVSGITVGTTTITSGTDTRIPFNDGGIYNEDSAFSWDKTNNALIISSLRLFDRGTDNTFLGDSSGNFTFTSAISNLGIGSNTLGGLTTGDSNTAIGQAAFTVASSGSNNTAIGTGALNFGNGSNNGNTAIGAASLNQIGIGANNNTAIGFAISGSTVTTGSSNVLIGAQAGVGVGSGSNNIIIGTSAGPASGSTSNQLTIQNAIYGINNSATGGSISTGNIGLYIQNPTARLHLPACTATANMASLKIDPGIVATIAVSGNIESDGTHLYWTDSGGTRKQLD